MRKAIAIIILAIIAAQCCLAIHDEPASQDGLTSEYAQPESQEATLDESEMTGKALQLPLVLYTRLVDAIRKQRELIADYHASLESVSNELSKVKDENAALRQENEEVRKRLDKIEARMSILDIR